MFLILNKYTVKILSGILIIPVYSSCSDNKDNSLIAEKSAICVSASLKDYFSSRSYIEEGQVTDGMYALIYKSSNGLNEYAYVDFNTAGNGTGFVRTLIGNELTWGDVSPSAPFRFTLDNISSEISISSSSVSFDENNPYTASLLDTKNGSNDLLWGVTNAVAGSPIINFELDHKMSLLCVEITVNSNWTGSLDLSQATVEITNIRQRLMSFNRNTGVPTTAGNNNPANYTLTLIDSKGDSPLNWSNITQQNENISIYLTQSFVIPPQTITKGQGRPELVITIPQETGSPIVYSGYLPTAMTIGSESNGQYFSELEFLEGKFLTIHTTINSPDRKLEFVPVTYVDWIYKGRYPISGFMSGVYDSENFNSMIDAILSKDPAQMKYFGSQRNNGQWVFNIWSNLILILQPGLLKDSDLNFSFDLHGHTLILKQKDSDKGVEIDTSDGLINYLKGNL